MSITCNHGDIGGCYGILFVMADSGRLGNSSMHPYDMGTSPYDAMPTIIFNRLHKVPYKVVRIGYDAIVAGIALLLGGKLGIVTVLMVLALGPVIEWLSKLIAGRWDFSE